MTPELGGITAKDKRIRFWTLTENTFSRLLIGTAASPNPALSSIDWIDTITFAAQGTGTEIEVISNLDSINGYNGTDNHVVLAHDLGSTFTDILVDDFTYEDIPTCVRPNSLVAENFNADTAEISWNDPNGASNWQIEYGFKGFTQGTGDTMTVSNDSITLTGLTPGIYDLFVRAICTVGDTSLWAKMSFEFCSGEVQAGYFTDFESDILDSVPACWGANVTYGTPLSEPRVDNAFPNPIFGSQSANLDSWTGFTIGIDDNNFVTPRLGGITDGDKRIRFWTLTENTLSRLFIGTASNQAGANVDWIDTITYTSAGFGSEVEVIANLDSDNGYNGTHRYVVLAHES